MSGASNPLSLITGKSSKSATSSADQTALRSAADKQAARNAVNALFGVAPSMDNITPDAYNVSSTSAIQFNPANGHVLNGGVGGSLQNAFDLGGALFGGGTQTHNKLDQAAYDAAVADYNKDVTDAAANKTARNTLYDTVRSDAYDAGKTNLDDSKTTAARNNKFALFAQGLNGGSQDVDESSLLDRTYNQGLLDLGAKADAAKSSLQSSDEAARLSLLQAIDSGTSQSDALTSAISQMKTGADSAEAAAQGTNLGDLFATSGLLYTKSNAARGATAASNYLSSLFGSSAAGLSGSKSSGIVSSTG